MVDGCFWHRCPVHGLAPHSNGTWWKQKLGRNVERDRQTDAELDAQGWKVECENEIFFRVFDVICAGAAE
jgi:DNA mismatch endonuclease (patch repair protein)